MNAPTTTPHSMTSSTTLVVLMVALLAAPPSRGQSPAPGSRAAGGGEAATVKDALAGARATAERSAAELADVRATIDEEKIPLMNELDRLDDELASVRGDYERVLRIRDASTLDVSNTQARIEARRKQNEYLTTQLDQFIREFETLLHVAELQLYGAEIEALKREIKAEASLETAFDARMDLVELAIARLEGGAGGMRFKGKATNRDGVLAEGTFAVIGSRAYFAGPDDGHVGIADSRNDSLEPAVVETPAELKPAIRAFVEQGSGALPVDITEGEAIKLAETRETVVDEIRKGGLVMYPLLGLGALSLLVAVIKWVQLLLVRGIGAKSFRKYLGDLAKGDVESARERIKGIRGPVGRLLRTGIEHRDEPRDLVEEVLYEDVLKARQSLGSFIPFIKISAAASPLLGLLGTVSGMINTFKLITVFGTGDASTFSSGISEALITTKWGLIVAIPCLLVAAFLGRRVKGVLDDMEKMALAIVNHLRTDGRGPVEGGTPTGRGGVDKANRIPADQGVPDPAGPGAAPAVGDGAPA